MAGEAHLKVAANNMRQAVSDVQVEINTIRNSMGQHERDMNQEINSITEQIRRSEVEIMDTRKSEQERAMLRKRVQDMQAEISNRRHQFDELHSQLERQIAAKQNGIQQLENQARQVEQEASAGM